MHELFTLNGLDQRVKVQIPVLQKEELILEMPVHRGLDCGCAYPDPLTAKQGR